MLIFNKKNIHHDYIINKLKEICSPYNIVNRNKPKQSLFRPKDTYHAISYPLISRLPNLVNGCFGPKGHWDPSDHQLFKRGISGRHAGSIGKDVLCLRQRIADYRRVFLEVPSPSPIETNIRSIAIADDGRIYAGGQGTLGFFLPDQSGKLQYKSLIPLLPSGKGIKVLYGI